LVNQQRELRVRLAPLGRYSCRELLVLLRHRVHRQVRRRPDHRELLVPAEAVVLAPLDYPARPDSLPAAGFVQPAAVAAAAGLAFQADFARTKLVQRR
jgi:hypothetical protein